MQIHYDLPSARRLHASSSKSLLPVDGTGSPRASSLPSSRTQSPDPHAQPQQAEPPSTPNSTMAEAESSSRADYSYTDCKHSLIHIIHSAYISYIVCKLLCVFSPSIFDP